MICTFKHGKAGNSFAHFAEGSFSPNTTANFSPLKFLMPFEVICKLILKPASAHRPPFLVVICNRRHLWKYRQIARTVVLRRPSCVPKAVCGKTAHMVFAGICFQNFYPFVFTKLPQYLSYLCFYFSTDNLPAKFWSKYYMILAFVFAMC